MRNRFLIFASLILASSQLNFTPKEWIQEKSVDAAVEMRPQGSVKAVTAYKFNGLLLGTHRSSGDGNFREVKAADRTWWIAEIGGQIQIREIPNILFPRKDGFWTAGTQEIQNDESFERYVWIAPLGKLSESLKPDLSKQTCSGSVTARDILFLGTDYIAIRQFGSGVCAHYDEGTVFYVSTPQNPNWLDTGENFGLKISDVLGPVGLDDFNKAFAAMGEAKSEDLNCGRLSARPENWAILRDKGHWVAKGNGSYGGHVCDGYFGTEFDIKTSLPKRVIGYDELTIGWDGIQKSFADAEDAFESPDGNFLVILRAGELGVYRLANGKIADVVARRPLHENEYAIMAQWALGENVAHWDQQISRIFNSPPALKSP